MPSDTLITEPRETVPPPPEIGHSRMPNGNDEASATLDPLELEALALNLEASLRVYTSHHFFAWTQGLLQNVIRHEVLICALKKGEGGLGTVESFSMSAAEPEPFCHLLRQDSQLAEQMIREWEEHLFKPLVWDVAQLVPESPLGRELQRLGATRLIVHGTYDCSGRMASFFIFACCPEEAGARQARLAELLVPSLHAAWLRTRISLVPGTGERTAGASARDILTQREQEVLKWVYLGKSNIEIGMILGISALTVKNHVQEILRRLNVQNRAQAVGKAFSLHILSN